MTTEFHLRIDTHDLSILAKIIEHIQPEYYVFGKEIAKKTKKEHIHVHIYKTISIKPESFSRKLKRDILQKLFQKSSSYSIATSRDSLKSQLYVCKDGNFQFSEEFPEKLKDSILDQLEKLNEQKSTPFKDQLINIFKNKISLHSNGRLYDDIPDDNMHPAEICNRIYLDINEDRISSGMLPPTHTDCIKYMKYLTLTLNDILHPSDYEALEHFLFQPFKY
ncbi:MAG: replicase [Cressdnaviricota sp.]|nr:MAG: replicase [Cressdnaviricota sp.]